MIKHIVYLLCGTLYNQPMIHMHLLPFLKYHFIIHHSHPKWHASIFFFCLLFTLSLNNLKKDDSKCLELLKSAKCSVNHFSLYWALLTIFICIVLLTVASLITFQTYHKKVNHFNTLNQTPEIIVIVMNPSETSLSLSYPSVEAAESSASRQYMSEQQYCIPARAKRK